MNQTDFIPLSLLKIEGPPGSGKTRELAREACRLIVGEGIAPECIQIVCVTQSNKRRVLHYLLQERKQAGLENTRIEISTFDEWFLAILKESCGKDSSKGPSLLSEADAKVLLLEILRRTIPAGHPLYYASRQPSASRVFYELIRQLQLQGLSPGQVLERASKSNGGESRLTLVAEIYRQFQEKTHAARLFSTPDLAKRSLDLLTDNPKMRETLAARYSVILVDEAQELSEMHHRVLALLPVRLVLAGNERLSIRSFRGAQPSIFADLSLYGQRPVTFLPRQACMRGNEVILSLLNKFLPQPIWEEQSPDQAQLSDLVRFGFYSDLEQEASGVAQLIETFVRTSQVEDRPALWGDCVILLRSAHYRQHLIHALMQRKIPFQCDLVSEDLLRLQHLIFDLFSVYSGWLKLNLTAPLLKNPAALRFHLAQLPLSQLEQAEILETNHRHLLRWLEFSLDDHALSGELRHLHSAGKSDETSANWFLFDGREASTLPMVAQETLNRLIALYGAYQADGSLVALIDSALRPFLNDLDDVPAGVSSGLALFKINLARLDRNYQSMFNAQLSLEAALVDFQVLWEGVFEPEKGPKDGKVRLMSIHQVQGEEYPCVVIPFLVSEEFPQTRDLPELLSEPERHSLGANWAYRIDEAEEARLLATGMNRATQRLALTCHRLDAGQPVLPSAFFRKLLDQKRLLLAHVLPGHICQCESKAVTEAIQCGVDFCTLKPVAENAQEFSDEDALEDQFSRYIGGSAWSGLPKASPEPLFEPEKAISLSASSIKTYMTCPRQFYYKHLLRLPQAGSASASLGTLIHRLMEVFNHQASSQPYTKERLKLLSKALFAFEDDPKTFFNAGFTECDLQTLRQLSPLKLTLMQQRLMASIEDLEGKGYFERYGTLKRVEPEKRLENIVLQGIEGCTFTGSMDALVQLRDGTWEIIDYKTFSSAYGSSPDSCDKHFLQTLDSLPEEEGLTHAERFSSKLNTSHPKDYQLPLYYLACSQDANYQGQLRSVSLQVIRPAFADKPEQGAIRLEITGAEIEARKERMVQDINQYIVSPIREGSAFAPEPSALSCRNCGYMGICEMADDSDVGEGE